MNGALGVINGVIKLSKNKRIKRILSLMTALSMTIACFSCSNGKDFSESDEKLNNESGIQTESQSSELQQETEVSTTVTTAITTTYVITTTKTVTTTAVSTPLPTQPPTLPQTQPPPPPPAQPQTQPPPPPPTEPPPPPTEPPTEPPAQPKTIEEIINSMSVREKVGQLIFIRPEALDPNIPAKKTANTSYKTTKLEKRMTERYKQYPVGGFALFSKNLTSPAQLKNLTAQLHGLGSVRPLISIDEEGGKIARIANHNAFNVPVFANMQDIAESGDVNQAYNLGNAIGGYLNEYGIDLDFAPVADVNTNPENTVIGVRAFGNNPQIAGQMVSAALNGLHSRGVMGCIKHFPGHGDTKNDTHSGYAETLKSWDEIKACEMLPFVEGINSGTDMVMAAHISAPNVTGDNLPASLSYTLITEKLRNELGYDGVIITDAMEMGAITQQFSSGDAAVRAIKAGVDIILMPQEFTAAFDSLVNAVNCGDISQERLYQSDYRILSLKQKYNG